MGQGRARFHHYEDMLARIDDPALPVTADSVLVLKNAEAVGVPGMPEWGSIPIPKKLLSQGIKDIVRISDSRMSGASSGTTVLHISPETAVGGPPALVEDGDMIELDVEARRLSLLVAEDELARRRARWTPPARASARLSASVYRACTPARRGLRLRSPSSHHGGRPCFCTCAVVPHMIAQRGGVILCTSSVAGLIGECNIAVYSASKGALLAMARAMAADYARYGIRVNTLCPGWIDTPINAPFFLHNPTARTLAVSYQPLGRLGLPADVAASAVFLCTDDASFITGTSLVVDGGFSSTWLETPPATA